MHSDIATLTFGQDGQLTGRFHLGREPGDYWDGPTAEPVDHPTVAAAFCAWVAAETGRVVEPTVVEAHMAKPGRTPPEGAVEDEVCALLNLALPLPPDWVLPDKSRFGGMTSGVWDPILNVRGVRMHGKDFRFVAGSGEDFHGVWDKLSPEEPVAKFPKNGAGWRQARNENADRNNALPEDEWLVP